MPTVYEIITEQVIKQLESGVAPWQKPWRTDPPANLISGKEYRGLNVFLLACQGWGSRYWLTYAQAQRLGGHVKKGEHGTMIVFWKPGEERTVTDTNGRERKSRAFLLRYFRVFNVQQTEGIAEKLGLGDASPRTATTEQCQHIVDAMPNRPAITQNAQAWYRPASDTVGIPNLAAFDSPEGYFATLYHELIHSTGHTSRVGRPEIEQLNTFGSESYSREELVAELGASMLCGIVGIAPRTISNSASYLQTWISRLRGDSKLIVSAASAAQKAADYIRGAQPAEVEA